MVIANIRINTPVRNNPNASMQICKVTRKATLRGLNFELSVAAGVSIEDGEDILTSMSGMQVGTQVHIIAVPNQL